MPIGAPGLTGWAGRLAEKEAAALLTGEPFRMREEVLMNRCGWLVLLVFSFVALPAFGRTWTQTGGPNNSTQTIEGDFVNVVGRGTVVTLSSSGRIVSVRFFSLIPQDQEFVRQLMEKQGRGNELPPRRNTQSPSSQTNSTDRSKPTATRPAADANAKPAEERTWTDINGAQSKARFDTVDNGKVVLISDQEKRRFPFQHFSRADQDYVRKVMIGRGEGYKLPPLLPPTGFMPTAKPANNQSGLPFAVAQAAPNASQTESPNQPDAKPQEAKPLTGPKPPRWPGRRGPPNPNQPAGLARGGPPNPNQSAGAARGGPPLQAANHATSKSSAAPPKASPLVGNLIAVNSAQTATEIANASPPLPKRVCSNCGEAIPGSCKPGDYCPHCKTYLAFEDTGHERVAAPFAFSTVGIPAGIASLLYAAVVGIVRLQRPSRKR
jgi:hypothetical protein